MLQNQIRLQFLKLFIWTQTTTIRSQIPESLQWSFEGLWGLGKTAKHET